MERKKGAIIPGVAESVLTATCTAKSTAATSWRAPRSSRQRHDRYGDLGELAAELRVGAAGAKRR